MQTKTLYLSWQDPRDESYLRAGVAFFINEYGEFALKIDEEPREKRYFLKPIRQVDNKTDYRMELLLINKKGKCFKRQVVGYGQKATGSNDVIIRFGSKFKNLILHLKENYA